MIQLEGSHHDWFGREQQDCLLAMIDDATGRRRTRMGSEETTIDALQLDGFESGNLTPPIDWSKPPTSSGGLQQSSSAHAVHAADVDIHHRILRFFVIN